MPGSYRATLEHGGWPAVRGDSARTERAIGQGVRLTTHGRRTCDVLAHGACLRCWTANSSTPCHAKKQAHRSLRMWPSRRRPFPRLVLCLSDQAAAYPFQPEGPHWAAQAFAALGITVEVVELPADVRPALRPHSGADAASCAAVMDRPVLCEWQECPGLDDSDRRREGSVARFPGGCHHPFTLDAAI